MLALPKPDKYSDKYRHIMPQYDFVFDNTGKLLVDFIGRFENLHEDFQIILKKLSLPLSNLPHINAASSKSNTLINKFKSIVISKCITSKKQWIDYYDSETREKVASLYAKDIKEFNYKFDFKN